MKETAKRMEELNDLWVHCKLVNCLGFGYAVENISVSDLHKSFYTPSIMFMKCLYNLCTIIMEKFLYSVYFYLYPSIKLYKLYQI